MARFLSSEVDFGDEHSQADVGPSENTRSNVVIIESNEEDNASLFQENLCVFSKFPFTVVYMVVNYMYLRTPFYDRTLIKTFVKFMTVEYNSCLISCYKVCPQQ